MPGLLVEVAVVPGQAVQAGERLAVIEAMKMENILTATQDGVVREVMAAKGVHFAPGGIRPGAADHDIIFIHPKGNEQFALGGEGVLIELVQAPPEVIAALR